MQRCETNVAKIDLQHQMSKRSSHLAWLFVLSGNVVPVHASPST